MNNNEGNCEIADQVSGTYFVSDRKKRPVYRSCDMCGGSGQYSYSKDFGGGFFEGGIGVCPECGGRGEIDTGMYVYE